MAVIAIDKDYAAKTGPRDTRESYHGNIMVYVHWEEHLFFCATLAFPLPPAMPFGALVSEVIAPHYAAHPDAAHINWSNVEWMINGEKTKPDFNASLEANGIDHKSLIRFWTPGLHGETGH
ncbi:phenol hydroxylase subunit P4 [Acidocella sp.]|jgi:phenol hydroxylase P4 protein|uniref:phenol hydroxylase subunit P4 n=1 Tax=Acidocella sp. TaxID=50710 RepID=UPI00260B1C17|nr:phenol hydroxylase subunit P4 [Acidocella sp.]